MVVGAAKFEKSTTVGPFSFSTITVEKSKHREASMPSMETVVVIVAVVTAAVAAAAVVVVVVVVIFVSVCCHSLTVPCGATTV